MIKIKNILKKIKLVLWLRKQVLFFFNYPDFILGFLKFKKEQSSKRGFSMNWFERKPCLFDKTKNTGFDNHYIYHTSWAARKVKEINPELHIDVSSSLFFCSIVSAFVPVEFYDIRPPKLQLPNLDVKTGNLMNLPFADNSVKSLSCMHTVEHVGLGRYGDPIDSYGDLKAIKELKRVLSPKGRLLFVVPLGRPKIIFNAHRIYSYKQVLSYFEDLDLKEFSLIKGNNGIIWDASKSDADKESYGCGCFLFTKP